VRPLELRVVGFPKGSRYSEKAGNTKGNGML
jgi:hypothetical protein